MVHLLIGDLKFLHFYTIIIKKGIEYQIFKIRYLKDYQKIPKKFLILDK